MVPDQSATCNFADREAMDNGASGFEKHLSSVKLWAKKKPEKRGDYLMCVLQAILNALELFDGLVGEGKLKGKKKKR